MTLLAAVTLLTACTSSVPQEPGTPSPSPTPTAATIRWDYPDVEGYALSEDPPAPGVIELENADAGCVLQLTDERLPGSADDDTRATRDAIENAMGSLGETSEVDRRQSDITTDDGPLPATEVSFTAVSGAQELDVRMMLRAVTADGVLVGIVHICPTGSIDEDVWSTFVAQTTLHGARATTF
ncbi:hypothetical protein [Georgenia alba]|uniref:Lipoprotein n=1 Tax=Georgenia alba TaxID=2233858 RepID=A0ABW2Q8S5_9MICO